MKTNLIVDYEMSKAFQYYFAMLGKIPLKYVEDSDIVDFFGFDWMHIGKEDLKNRELPYIESTFKIPEILSALTLFDEITLDTVDDEGASNNKDFLNEMGISLDSKIKRISKSDLEKTVEIFKSYRKEIIAAVNQDDCFRRLRYVANECPIFEMYVDNKMYLDAFEGKVKTPFGHLRKRIDSLIPDFGRMRGWWDPEEYAYEAYMDKVFLHIYEVVSSKNSCSLSKRFLVPNSAESVSIKELAKDNRSINECMAEFTFNKGVMLIPQPQTLQDVIELRRDPDMQSFRSVYSQWVSYLENGDMDTFRKMKEDVLKARNALDKLTKFKKVDGNILSRALFMIGGEIPILAEILSVYGFVQASVVDSIEAKNRWCCLPGLKSTSNLFVQK